MMDIIHIDTLHYLSLNLPNFLVMCVSRMIVGSTNTSILSFVNMFFFGYFTLIRHRFRFLSLLI